MFDLAPLITIALALTGELPEVDEIHSVAGDASVLLKVRCLSSRALEGLLARLYASSGVKSTRSDVIRSTYLDRTTRAGITESLETEEIPLV